MLGRERSVAEGVVLVIAAVKCAGKNCSGACEEIACEATVAALVAEHGDGLPLTAHLYQAAIEGWNRFDVVARLEPNADFVALYVKSVREPLEAAARHTAEASRGQ